MNLRNASRFSQGLFEGALLLDMLAGIPSCDSLENLKIYLLSCYPFAGRSWANRGLHQAIKHQSWALRLLLLFPRLSFEEIIESNPQVHIHHPEPAHPLEINLQHLKPSKLPRFSSWWLNQRIWKTCSSNWIISPILGVKIKNIWVATNQLQSQTFKNPPVRFFRPKHFSNLATHGP